MSFTSHELADFHHFAEQRVAAGNVDSLEQLAQEWSTRRQLASLARDISESEADIDAGRVHSAEDVIAEARRKLGISP
ncbi:MAG: hypothetical protein MI757_14780 [Pirellulales bacterium]|nr:hypothetical protein [Pirellulales bacterium]